MTKTQAGTMNTRFELEYWQKRFYIHLEILPQKQIYVVALLGIGISKNCQKSCTCLEVLRPKCAFGTQEVTRLLRGAAHLAGFTLNNPKP